MSPAAPAEQGERLHALDGMRGAAAVAVFLYHSLVYVPVPGWLLAIVKYTPLGVAFNGPGAVHVFFVLSGYVLAMALEGDTRPGRLPRYYLRRVFRIQPPYAAGVLLAWVASILLLGGAADPALRLPEVAASRLWPALVIPSRAFGLLPVGWSLFVELVMSLLFPLLLLLARRVHWLAPLGLALALLFLVDALAPSLRVLTFTLDFAVGLSVRVGAAPIATAIAALPPIAPLVFVLVGLAALQAPMLDSLVTVGFIGLARGHAPGVIATLSYGAGLLLIGVLHLPAAQRWLSTAVARHFGRISYSLYLVHNTALLVFIVLAGPLDGAPWRALGAVALAFGASVALSEVGWRLVEAPSVRAGRAVIRAIEARRAPMASREA